MITTGTGRMAWQVSWKRVCATACASVLLASTPIVAQQSSAGSGNGSQSNSSPNDSSQSKSRTQPPAAPAQKGAAQENPFPSDVSRQAAQQSGDPSTSTPPAAPDAPDAGQTPPPAQKPGQAAQENPFPEDVSKGAAAAASKASDPDASSAGASSSSSSSSANGGADPAGGDPNGDIPPTTGRRKLRKPSEKDIQSGSIAGQGRAQDDVKIGRFYLGDGNYLGAYGRFSEAARLDPANVNAIYGLAAAAEGLHHTDEALSNYKLYLSIAPDGDHAKAAEKAIRALAK